MLQMVIITKRQIHITEKKFIICHVIHLILLKHVGKYFFNLRD